MDHQIQAAQNIGGGLVHLVGFSIGGQDFGIDIVKVQEIIKMVAITKVPNAPEYVEGVIDLRGKVLPVIDFRKRFSTSFDDDSGTAESKRIVVIDINGLVTGIIVDKVSQVLKLREEDLSPPPPAVKGMDSECICAVGKMEGRLLIILDAAQLCTNMGEVLADAA